MTPTDIAERIVESRLKISHRIEMEPARAQHETISDAQCQLAQKEA